MPSRIDEAGHTKAFDDPVAEHWGESQRAKRSLVGLEPTSAHTYESEIQRSPLIDDILAQLKGAKYFSSLDLKSGYWQVKMAESDKDKTAFTCHKGLYEFNVMPFGLANAPGVFQELMAIVLLDSGHFTIAYLDNILIFSQTLEEHLSHIQIVFDRLGKHGLKLKLSKCQFMQTETNYLGFVINQEGIQPNIKKVEVIRGLPLNPDLSRTSGPSSGW